MKYIKRLTVNKQLGYTLPDWAGIFSASLCAVHCLFTPILLTLATNYWWWHELSYVFLLISFLSVYKTTDVASPRWIQQLLWWCIVLLTIAVLFEDSYEGLHELSYLAGVGLIIGHVAHLRHCHACNRE